MQPLDCYADISDRAQRLLRIHDGLVNRRTYAIRRDWATRFKALMRWPAHIQLARIDGYNAIVILKHTSILGRNDFAPDTLDDLLRMALALGVSALDRYVHERVMKDIVSSLRSAQLSRRQADFLIPAHTVLKVMASARRAPPTSRPANRIRSAIQELIHTRPFQSWREIEYAFELIGITSLNRQIQSAYGVANITPIKAQLNDIIRKRNHIVHEGDLVRHARAGRVRKNAIAPGSVHASLDFLDNFIVRLDAVR